MVKPGPKPKPAPDAEIDAKDDVIELTIRLRSGRFTSRLEVPLHASKEEKERGLEMWADLVATGFKYGATEGEIRAPIKKADHSGLIKRCRDLAVAQQELAAKTSEDRTHWHHVGLANALNEAAIALEQLG